MDAYELNNAIKHLRINRQSTEANLVFTDGSSWQLRSDAHTHWLQSQGRQAEALHKLVAAFKLAGRKLHIGFHDGSRIEVFWRLHALETKVHEA